MIKEKLKILLKDNQEGHSEFQIKNFIINSQIHPWHRYKQCLREIAGRKESVESGAKQALVLGLEIKKLKRKLFLRKKNASKISELNYQKRSALKSARKAERELNLFVNVALELRENYNYHNLSFEQKELLEAEAWREKARYMFFIDLYCIGQPSKQTIEFIYMLPKKIKRDLFLQMGEIDKKKIHNYLIEG
jgi:hypothetical protein